MSRASRLLLPVVGLALAATPSPSLRAAPRPPPVVGRWNLTVTGPDGAPFPSWLEITFGPEGLGGRFCGRAGVAHALARVQWTKTKELIFTDASQEGGVAVERIYRAKIRNGELDGTSAVDAGAPWTFGGVRSPKLVEPHRPHWGKAVPLIARGLNGWRLRGDGQHACWTATDGTISNKTPCVDIISDGKYENFKLHVELKLGPKSSSGVYLRGRYEVRIADDAGAPPGLLGTGAVHGLLAPTRNAAGKADEWQTLDVTLLGRKVAVVLNGQSVIDGQDIIGPTGGALNSDEAVPGPIMIRGSEGSVSFRNVVITPISM
jgi:hypothetical protein